MSHRPIEGKHRRRVAKAFRQKLPAYFDLVQWLQDHGHAKSRREAREIILDKRVRTGSHVLGVSARPKLTREMKIEQEDYVDQYVPVDYRTGMIVL